jgi:hypothetical protein
MELHKRSRMTIIILEPKGNDFQAFEVLSIAFGTSSLSKMAVLHFVEKDWMTNNIQLSNVGLC